jgi:ATP/maltotriose-dependent transcriptional regulator MalT
MPKRSTRLAKLTRPRLHNVLARHRLFAQLDAARGRAVVWVAGPPGSGKTALVASYLDATRLRCVWYHLDSSDHEPATFFHYLSQCIDATSRQGPLPRITPEHLADLPAFTRYYFREFFARLKSPAVLVFDNYQDIPVRSVLHAVLEQAALESPEGIGLVFISREDPPPEYARLDASDRLARIEWSDLRLTLPEAAAIAALRFDLDAAALRRVYDACNGWAAGLTLALERMKRSDGPAGTLQGAALESVFNYFAGQILNTAEPAVREFLLRTALFARTTAQTAADLSGNPQAARLLEYFYRRRLFTDRRGEPPYSYQYHDLFRAFLLDQLEHSRPRQAVDALRCYQALDRRTEAIGTYQRLKQTLSVALGLKPSASTEKLYDAMRSA